MNTLFLLTLHSSLKWCYSSSNIHVPGTHLICRSSHNHFDFDNDFIVNFSCIYYCHFCFYYVLLSKLPSWLTICSTIKMIIAADRICMGFNCCIYTSEVCCIKATINTSECVSHIVAVVSNVISLFMILVAKLRGVYLLSPTNQCALVRATMKSH